MLADAVGRFLGFIAISGPGWILLMPAGGGPAGPTLGAFTILGRTPRDHTDWLRKRREHAHQLAYRSIPLFPSRTRETFYSRRPVG
jgi:hypothetical protein